MTDIDIHPELRAEIDDRIEGTTFVSVDEYVDFVLREVLESDADAGEESAGPTDRDRDLTQQLEDLGYV